MRARSLRPPVKIAARTLAPLLCIGGFTLFVVWQWSGHPGVYRSEHYGVGGGAGALSTTAIPGNLLGGDATARSNDLVAEKGKGEAGCRCEAPAEERGAVPLLKRNATDEKIYRLAIAAEESRLRRARLASDDGGDGRRAAGDSESCRCALKSDGAKAKVAFLFMITSAIPFAPLWNEYFAGHEGLYNLYVHADPFNASLFAGQGAGVFRGRLIRSQKALRGSPSLVQASNRLLANALLDDPANSHFVLLSGACIPIRAFPVAYRKLTPLAGRSFLEQIRNESIMWERYTGRAGGAALMQPEIPFDRFRKAAHWFVFSRAHALLVLRDVQERRYWSKFDRECKIYFCGTDEHYYPTLLHILDPAGVTGTSVTYVHWPDYVTEHPTLFRRYNVNESFIADLQQKNDQQYLFARKFAPDTLDLLMAMNDTLLS